MAEKELVDEEARTMNWKITTKTYKKSDGTRACAAGCNLAGGHCPWNTKCFISKGVHILVPTANCPGNNEWILTPVETQTAETGVATRMDDQDV